MFCFQCQETAKNTGCTVQGVCGKTGDTAGLQDLLVHVLKGLAIHAVKAAERGPVDRKYGRFAVEALFATITNANFDQDRFIPLIRRALNLREELRKSTGADTAGWPDPAVWYSENAAEFAAKAALVGVMSTENEDIRSLRELLIYGLKGIAAYTDHAAVLGFEDEDIYRFLMEGLASTARDLPVDEMVGLVMRAGECAVKAMALLDKANTSTYGTPELTRVDLGVRENPGILVSGHDLKDLDELLQQTANQCGVVDNHYPRFRHLESSRQGRAQRLLVNTDAPQDGIRC